MNDYEIECEDKDFSILKSEEVLGKEPSPLVQLKKKDRKDKSDKSTSTTSTTDSSDLTGITDEVTDIKGDETPSESAESTDKPFIDDKPKITSPLISEPFRPSSSIPSPPPISKSSKIPPSDKSDESTVHSFASDRPGDQTSSISSDQCAIRVNESSVSSIDDQKISGGGDDDDETTEFDLEKARKAIEKLQVEDSDQSKLNSEKNDRSLLTDSPPPISRSQLDSLDPKSDDSSDIKSPDIKSPDIKSSDLKSSDVKSDRKSDDIKSDVKSDIKSKDKKSSDKSFDVKSDVKSDIKSKDIQSEAKKDDERKIDIDDNINRNVNRNVKSDDNNDKFNKDDNNNNRNVNVNDDEEMKDLTNVKSDDKSVKSNIDSNLSQKNVDSTAFTGVDDKKGACDVATSQTRPPIDPLL